MLVLTIIALVFSCVAFIAALLAHEVDTSQTTTRLNAHIGYITDIQKEVSAMKKLSPNSVAYMESIVSQKVVEASHLIQRQLDHREMFATNKIKSVEDYSKQLAEFGQALLDHLNLKVEKSPEKWVVSKKKKEKLAF